MMSIYVDASLTLGSYESITEVIEDSKIHDFSLNIEEKLKDYLRFCIKINEQDGITWILQPS
jgi:hypothetical protein